MKTHNSEETIKQLGLELPPAPPKGGVYHPVVQQDNRIYISGQAPLQTDGSMLTGKVGQDLNADAGKQAARQVGLAMLATIKEHYGTLNEIKRLLKLFGMVNAAPDFKHHPYVINGCSELFVDIWGEHHGAGARSAVGMGSLPNNMAVEIEAIFEVH